MSEAEGGLGGYRNFMTKFIAAIQDGQLVVHAKANIASYETLCGSDTDDPALNVFPAAVPIGTKITCKQCKQVFEQARKFRVSEFA